MMNYKIRVDGFILTDDGRTIPPDEGNGDYQQFLLWVAAGNEPEQADRVTLGSAQVAIANQIEEYRLAVSEGGIVWREYIVQTNATSLANLGFEVNAALAGIRQNGDYWRMGANEMVSLSNADLIEMAGAVRSFATFCYQIAWYHKDQMRQIPTVQGVLSYDFRQGWDFHG